MLSGAFCVSGSGYYVVDAVREDSYASKLAGEAKTFRHPPSPLQVGGQPGPLGDDDRDGAAGAHPAGRASSIRSVEFTEAAQTATAGLITLIPEGLVLLMSVTLAVAAVRLARQNTLVQQMAATEALAAVDTICVDKTGTLTDGTLRLIEVVPTAAGGETPSARSAASPPPPESATGPWRRSPRPFPPSRVAISDEVPFSSKWKWSGLTLNGEGRRRSYVIGAPDVLVGAGVAQPAARARAGARASRPRRAAA